jgi:hypothetical protein
MKDSLKTLQLQDSVCWLAYLYAGAKPKSLIRHVPHRWFSIFVMLERMVELKPFLRRLCNETNHHDWFPTEGDWNAALWLLETLSSLKKLSDKLEMCHDVTISLVSLQSMIELIRSFLLSVLSRRGWRQSSTRVSVCNLTSRTHCDVWSRWTKAHFNFAEIEELFWTVRSRNKHNVGRVFSGPTYKE